MLNVALAKGRLADSCADIFLKCGIRAEILKEETRKLVLETPDKKFRFFFVKPADVPTYVEYGIAEIGSRLGKPLSELADVPQGADVREPLAPPTFTQPLNSAISRYDDAQVDVIRHRNAKRERHARAWARWSRFNR